ncbi:MAG: hypothetical protein WC835_02265 [Candidatus Paceibacterota bacterium]
MNLFSKNSKCGCAKIKSGFPQHGVKKYLAIFFIALFIMLVIPSAKAQFWNSGEQYIRDAYQTYLGHAPDQNAINYYLYEIEKGRSYDSIKSEIANSVEAKRYLLSSGPRILNFSAQKIDKNTNTWSFIWSTTNADQVALRFECIGGIKITAANTTDIFPCGENRKGGSNSGASFSFRNTTGRGLIMNARLYPVANNSIFLNAAKTVSFYVDKSLVPTAPLTSDYRSVQQTSGSAPKSVQASPKPVIIGPVQQTQIPKAPVADSFSVSDRSSLGTNAKRVSWKMSNADGVSVSMVCPPKVSVTLVTKGNTKKVFSCAGVGQKFGANDYADFVFSNKSKTITTVTVKLEPVVNGAAAPSKAVTKSFNLAK